MHSTPSTASSAPGIDRAQATRLALLAAVRDTGSISAAARAVGLSYKGAWQILDAMNRQSSAPLFNRSTGGSGGGGTVLTVQGEALLSASAMVSRLANTLSNALTGGETQFSLLARLGLKTSARNQFTGRISQLEHGAVNDTLTLTLDSGTELQVLITCESSQHMDLRLGSEVLALIKASWVFLAAPEAARQIAISNRLYGTVASIKHGAVNSEVLLALPGGGTVCAILESARLSSMALEPGADACALISPAHIILASLA